MAAQDHLGRQFHEMTRAEFERQPGTFFHGSVNGMVGAHGGPFHVGTKKAAREVLGGRIAVGTAAGPAWYRFGTRTPDLFIRNARKEGGTTITHAHHEPIYMSDPKVQGGRIVGPMGDETLSDEEANEEAIFSPPEGDLRHGRGIYYENSEEDPGSISAVLPSRSHFKTHEDYLVEARARGDKIPKRALRGYKEIPGQGRLF